MPFIFVVDPNTPEFKTNKTKNRLNSSNVENSPGDSISCVVLSVTTAFLRVGLLLREALQAWPPEGQGCPELGVRSAPGVPWGAVTELPVPLLAAFRKILLGAEARTPLAGFFQDPNLRSGTG